MDKIIEFALTHNDLERKGILDIVRELTMSGFDAALATEWLLGISSREEALAKVPTTVIHGGVTYTLTEVKFLERQGNYEYPSSTVRYFRTQEEADRYSNTREFNYRNYSDNQSEEFNFRGEWHYTGSSWISIDEWMKWSKEGETPQNR
jgi:hypothetical protein